MSDIELSSAIYPYRLKFGEKGAGELTIEVKNNSELTKNLLVELFMPSAVATNKSGLSQSFQKRVANLPPGKAFISKMPVFLSPRAEVGLHSGKLRVTDFVGNYEYERSRVEKPVAFRIEE